MSGATTTRISNADMAAAENAVSDTTYLDSHPEDFSRLHALSHKTLDSIHQQIATRVQGLREERAVIDDHSGLPIYKYWWNAGDQAFLQIDTRNPRIVLGSLNITVSAEKLITPERVGAMRDLPNSNPTLWFCRPGRRNTRWSFLLADVVIGTDPASQISELLAALHSIESTDFPKKFLGRFR